MPELEFYEGPLKEEELNLGNIIDLVEEELLAKLYEEAVREGERQNGEETW